MYKCLAVVQNPCGCSGDGSGKTWAPVDCGWSPRWTAAAAAEGDDPSAVDGGGGDGRGRPSGRGEWAQGGGARKRSARRMSEEEQREGGGATREAWSAHGHRAARGGPPWMD